MFLTEYYTCKKITVHSKVNYCLPRHPIAPPFNSFRLLRPAHASSSLKSVEDIAPRLSNHKAPKTIQSAIRYSVPPHLGLQRVAWNNFFPKIPVPISGYRFFSQHPIVLFSLYPRAAVWQRWRKTPRFRERGTVNSGGAIGNGRMWR